MAAASQFGLCQPDLRGFWHLPSGGLSGAQDACDVFTDVVQEDFMSSGGGA